jgi:hypothetical protein
MKTFRVGDILAIDCGYCGIDDTQPCRLLEKPQLIAGLFPDSPPCWTAKVQICGTGEIINVNLLDNTQLWFEYNK